ncbi:MAG: type 1 glutamine amidotransferase [Planctomycetota bacterium]|nr:type 1 glutamine amidotransferase [Planctomycetota bacterium]
MATIVFQHSDIGRPGRLGLTLRDHGHRLKIIRPDRGEAIPPDFDDVDGVISMGGPQSTVDAGSRPEWMEEEMAFLKEAHERALPVIGVCLGHQMLAVALGGETGRMAKPEVGFYPVDITVPGQTEHVLAGISWRSRQFCHHGDHVTKAPPGAVVLAKSELCPVQAFRAGLRTYAFQYHFEADRQHAMQIAESEPDLLHKAGHTEQEIAAQADECYEQFARLADRLCVNIATLVALVGRRHLV